MKPNNPLSYLIISAIAPETIGLENYAPVIHTGVGKLNGAIKTYQAILQYQPDLVINYGTAGGLTKNAIGLVEVGTFVQRDMDVRALGFDRGVVPFSGKDLPKKQGLVLGTGDNFVTNAHQALEGLDIALDLVDMEGFAVKEVCDFLHTQFKSYKYISDSADKDAKNDWERTLADGVKAFSEFLDQHYGQSSLLLTAKADYYIKKLALIAHPEGGYFKEVYRSGQSIAQTVLPNEFSGDRVFSTAIYYLLKNQDFSAFHQINQDEIWHFYDGSALALHLIDSEGYYEKIVLGRGANIHLQFVVKQKTWMAAEVIDKQSFSLIGATVAPGFDFADFTLAKLSDMLAKYPQHKAIINLFTQS